MSGCNKTDIEWDCLCAANPGNAVFLQCAQQLHLNRQGDVTYFIDKESSVIRLLK